VSGQAVDRKGSAPSALSGRRHTRGFGRAEHRKLEEVDTEVRSKGGEVFITAMDLASIDSTKKRLAAAGAKEFGHE